MADPSRQATIRTTVTHPAVVAEAIRPDNTDEMTTTVEEGAVVTTIDRETTGGLQSTVDDYVVNLEVACQVIATTAEHARSASGAGETSRTETDAGTKTTTNANADTNTNTDTTTETNDQQ